MILFHRFRSNRQGAAAVEFAIIAPLFLLVLMTLIAYAIYLTAAHSVQQITADAARTAVAGLSAQERETLVENFITTSTINHPLLQKDKIHVTVTTDPSNSNQFTVTTEYDATTLRSEFSTHFLYRNRRSAALRRSGWEASECDFRHCASAATSAATSPSARPSAHR